MVPSNDILARRNEIKDFIAAGNLEKALKRLIDFAREFCQDFEDAVILLSSDFSYLKKDIIEGTIDSKEVGLTRRQITKRALMSINEMINNLSQP